MFGSSALLSLAMASGPVVPSAPAITRAQLLAVILASVLLLLAWLVIVTIMRRALKGVGPASPRSVKSAAAPSAWQEAGQRVRADDTAPRERGAGGTLDDTDGPA